MPGGSRDHHRAEVCAHHQEETMKVKYPRVWRHKRYGKQNYKGKYRRVEGEREFFLQRESSGGHQFSAESHQAAIKAGWYTVDL